MIKNWKRMYGSISCIWTYMILFQYLHHVSSYRQIIQEVKKTNPEIKETVASITYPCSSFYVSDPRWRDQWYLNGSGVIPTDMNVLHAWRQCYNGTGITIAVVDDGLFDHPDLSIDRTLNADINPTVSYKRTHGTQVASIIAAKGNNICGIGIAFEATLADIRIITQQVEPDANVAAMLVSSMDKIDIYSNSYTNPSISIAVYNLGKEVLDALKRGTTMGRNGKGVIYVWSSGNGGHAFFPFGCAYEGLDNNPYIIPVAGIRWNYNKISTGESCSSILVTAFTRDPADTSREMITSEGTDGCSGSFGQNSAAVPVVSGAIALALQANPDLGYRDIMHLLVESSNTNLPFQPNDFIFNGAGKKVSKTFGFGLLDVGKLVDMAKSWKNVELLTDCLFISNTTCSLHSKRIFIVNMCKITSLEHVEVYFNVESPRAGKLKLDLRSPSGTSSNIIPGRVLDHRTTLNLTVISVHFWGESPVGNWTLEAGDLNNDTSGLVNGTMIEWRLKLYGAKADSTTSSTSKPYFSTTEGGEDIQTTSLDTSTYDVTKDSSKETTTFKTGEEIQTTSLDTSTYDVTKDSSKETTFRTETSTEENCEEIIPQSPDRAAEIGVPVAIVAASIAVAVLIVVLVILFFRRKSILSATNNSSCRKKMRTVENRNEEQTKTTSIRVTFV